METDRSMTHSELIEHFMEFDHRLQDG